MICGTYRGLSVITNLCEVFSCGLKTLTTKKVRLNLEHHIPVALTSSRSSSSVLSEPLKKSLALQRLKFQLNFNIIANLAHEVGKGISYLLDLPFSVAKKRLF